MSLRQSIKKILREELDSTAKDNLPKKPNKVLFNDFWLSQLETEGDYVKLYHFGALDLEYLDPSHFGKHSYTSSEQWWGKKRLPVVRQLYWQPLNTNALRVNALCSIRAMQTYPLCLRNN